MCTSNISDNFFMGIDIEPVGNLKNQFILSIDPGNIAMIRNHYKNNNQSDKIKYPSKFKDLLESVEADQNALLAIVTIKN